MIDKLGLVRLFPIVNLLTFKTGKQESKKEENKTTSKDTFIESPESGRLKKVQELLLELKDSTNDDEYKKVVDRFFSIYGKVATQAIVEFIKDSNNPTNDRVLLIRELANKDTTKETIASLVDLLRNDKDNRIWVALARALGRIGPDAKEAIPLLIKASKDKDDGVRMEVALALFAIAPDSKETLSTLIDLSNDGNPRVQIVAINILESIGSKEAVPALIRHLESRNIDARIDSARILGNLKSKEAVPHLVKALADSEEDVRRTVAKSLGVIAIYTDNVISALILLLNDNDRDVQDAAESTLIKAGSKALPYLVKELSNGKKYFSLIRQYGTDAVPHLLKALTDKDSKLYKQVMDNEVIRANLVLLLGTLGSKINNKEEQEKLARVIGELLLNDENYYVRINAATALGELKLAKDVSTGYLDKALKDNKKVVRDAVAEALNELKQ